MNTRAFAGAGAIAALALCFSVRLSAARRGQVPPHLSRPVRRSRISSRLAPAAARARAGLRPRRAGAGGGGRGRAGRRPLARVPFPGAAGRAGGGGGGFPGGGGRGGAVNLEACATEMANMCPGLNGGPAGHAWSGIRPPFRTPARHRSPRRRRCLETRRRATAPRSAATGSRASGVARRGSSSGRRICPIRPASRSRTP